MTADLTFAQLTGQDASHLEPVGENHLMVPPAAKAFGKLQQKASAAGFELAIASSYRSYERQLAIFNGKATGARPVVDDAGRQVPMSQLDNVSKLAAILRFSALPGTSRHHWGTDLDVFDAAAVAPDYRVQLTPAEVSEGGPFFALHEWLDKLMASEESCGFYRPYGEDRGGVSPERWHLSYAPVSQQCEGRLQPDELLPLWGERLMLGETIAQHIENVWQRYVRVEAGWCPRY